MWIANVDMEVVSITKVDQEADMATVSSVKAMETWLVNPDR